MHEIIAHYFNVKNKDDGGIEDHLAFFGIDPKNPYNDKFYKKNEIDAIMTLGTDVKGDASYSLLRFKPGSEAHKIMEAVESAIKTMKK